MSTLSSQIANLSPEQLAKLAYELKASKASKKKAMPKRVPGDPCPLSFAQQRLWFIAQLEPDNPTYNCMDALRMTGKLNLPLLHQTFIEVVRRHEALRTTFDLIGEEPVQIVSSEIKLNLSVIDLQALPESERETQVSKLSSAELQRPFDLTRGPLLRVVVLRVSEHDHAIVFTTHHIVSDGWSRDVLVREIIAIYLAFAEGQPSPLPELSFQYADFAIWQRQRLTGPVLEKHLDYWKQHLSNAPHVLALSTDHPRPAVPTRRGAYEAITLSPELSHALRVLSRRQGVTLFMMMLAAFDVLLSRYSGQTDFLIGTDIANRNQGTTESLIGFFVNQLVLRADLQGDPTFDELLERVKDTTLNGYAHQEAPFEKVVEMLNPERNLSHAPLFQVKLLLQNASMDNLELPELAIGGVAADGPIAKFDLTLTIYEGDQIGAVMEFATDLFESNTIERMLGHFEELLQSIVREPQQRVSRLALMNGEERQRLLSEWNETTGPYETDVTLGALFEQQVARDATAVAVVSGEEKLTYGELNEQANRVARYLQSLGIGTESRVGLQMERGLDLVVGLLGIVKAGAAYVPLDPSYPAERLQYMVADAGVALVLTGETVGAALRGRPLLNTGASRKDGRPRRAAPTVEVVKLSECQAEGVENLKVEVSGQNVAYVIYTSGSTGRPKGVMVTHDNVTRLFAAVQEEFRFNERDVWTMFHSYAFDFSVWELWGALLYGGKLVVVPYLVSRSPGEFWQLLEAEQVTVLSQTPSAFTALMRVAAEAGGNEQLRAVVFGGEALDYASLRGWVKERGVERTALVNMYGITETTVHVTYHRISEAEAQAARGSLIGKPIGDLQCYLLDEWQEPAPVGVSGEIYVGGAGLARGYEGNPALTAERFVPNPFSNEPGARLYKTGDLARHLPDGYLQYLGRRDAQEKIRGFRIEPGEVEAVLGRHDSVKECAVVIRRESNGEKRLVAYVVDGNEQGDTSELRDYLRERLPEFMLPSAIVELESLPLTTNGKVDRRELAAREVRVASGERSYVPPRTITEELICGVWAEVLGAERVGIHDNFFELGGDSILTIQVIVKARAAGLELNVQQLFKYQTVHELAQELERSSEISATVIETEPFSLISEEDRKRFPDGVVDAYPLTAMQAGMLFHSELTPEAGQYHDIFSFHLKLPFDSEALRGTLQQLIELHPVLRTSFNLSDFSEPLQLVHHEVAVPLRFGDLRSLPATEQEEYVTQWIAEEKQHPYDWREAPLLRFQIDRRTDESFQFSFSCHHAVLDGWSVATMLTELFNDYSSVIHGEDRATVVPLGTAFRDFVAAEQAALKSEEARQHWTGMLSDATQTRLPRLIEAGPTRVASRGVELSTELFEGLKQLARRAGVPLKSVMLAAHLRVLSLLSGNDDVLTGVVSHGRTETKDSERVLGLFLNTLPFRKRLSGGTWLELVQETFAAERESLPFRRYPLARMQQDVGSDAPLFETVFNFTHFHVHNEMQNVGGLEILSHHSVADTNLMFGVDFSLDLEGSGITMELQCDAGQWSESQLDAATRYYLAALEEMARTPLARYEHEFLLSDDERRTILHEWNAPAPELYSHCYHTLFEAEVARTPGALAVVDESGQLTYEELNSRANQLAHYLQKMGIGPEVPVAVLLERSLDTIVTLLAILKAGGVFVPLDEQQPAERQQYIVDDACIAALLTHTRFKEELPVAARVVYLDLEQEKIAAESTANLTGASYPESLAYVMYTSGSTGRPKGVGVTHEGIVSHSLDIAEPYKLRAGDRMLVFAALTSDISMEEILPTLLFGGSLIMRGGVVWTPSELVAVLAKYEISIFMLATAYWHKFTQDGIDELTSSLNVRLVAIGGEAASPEIVRRWQSSPMRDVTLINSYGPTETIITATWVDIRPEPDTDRLPTVSIGRPLRRRTAYILDSHGNPTPVGVPGELHIGGPVIARGYVHRPELTAERFIPDMFSDQPGGRLYRTGDLARYLVDGNIEFLGRIDHQVKIRGFRVELGEIEAALQQHASVKEAVVLYENERLIAYTQLRTEGEVGASELRAYLKEHLPEYMVPVVFVEIAEIPLTPNGKIDRRALLAVDTISAPDAEYEAPRTPAEELLSGLWANVLRADRVGINDNFFELGGHSLLAIQLISRIRDTFGLELPLIDLFEHPTVAALAQSVENRMRAGGDRMTVPLLPAPRDEALPLSFGQQRLWFLDQLAPESVAYNMGDNLRLYGELNVAALEQSLNEISRRHEVVRTTFPNVDGYPQQVITPFRHLHLPLIDLRSLPDAEREAEVARIAAADAQRPFDLQSGPLLRATLLLVDAEDHVLLFSMHHIISDWWSNGILVREVTALYDAFTTGNASPLPELSIQYGDYAVWQRQWLSGDVLARQLDYWTSKLQGAPALLALPTDYPRPKVQSTEGAFCTHILSVELTTDLKSLAQQSGATLFMTIMAAFHVLLHRYARQATIITGTPVANRTRVETESLIGFFVNTLVLRSDFDDDPSFLTHLIRLRKHALEAYAHQDLPFEMLVDELRLARDLSYNPLFQVMFTWEEASLDGLTLEGLTLGTVGVANETSQFDLTLHVTEFESGHLSFSMQYNTALFTEETIERMLGHYEELLQSIVQEPEQRVSRLALMNREERQRLLREWTETAGPYETDVTLGALFERQVARDAMAVAIVSGEEKLTYGELNEQANRVARYLQSLGLGAESRVGLQMERGLEMVVGLLGIVKAGAAYVPLDPSYPAERLQYMVADAGVALVLTGESGSAAEWEGVRAVKLSECSVEAAENVQVEAGGQNVAYVIYTSGSTGRPKGVMVTHDNVTRLFAAVQAEFQFNERDVWTMFHSYAFDFSVWELWGALLYGGKLVVVPYLVSRSPGEFWQLLAAEQVTVLSQTPSAFTALMRVAAEAGGNEQLRAVVFGGEALDYASLRGWVRERGVERTALVNMYGITETTVHVTYHRISEAEAQAARGSLIGKPIGDLQCYLLDEWQEPVPVGVSGEIYVGGAGLARGYEGNPGLTAERFVPNPFSGQPGARLYKTGDLARHLPDGNLEYLGRIDHQVKLRGFRIELGEIESVLKQHASVKEAIVVMPGEQRLVAYMQLLETAPAGIGELRAFLKERLPEYMVPASFVLLPEFPLTASGKIDKRALPAAESSAEVDYQAPRTETEELLTGLWENVLRVPRVGVHDNFFDLGGDSILTIQVIAKARAVGLELNVQQLFQYQTVHELAQELERSRESYATVVETEPFSLISEADRAALPAGVVDAYPLTAMQAGMLFHSELARDAGLYHEIFTFHLRLPFHREALRATLQHLIDQHPVLRTSFNLSDYSEPLQLVHQEVAVPLQIGDLRALSEAEQEEYVAQWMAADQQQGFDWNSAPLLRFQIDRRSEESFQFSFSFHHAILDGWSVATMFGELFDTYSVMQTQERVNTAPLGTTFRDFVAAEQAVLNSDEARQYWTEMLTDSTQSRLPRVGPGTGQNAGARMAAYTVDISRELSSELKELAHTAGVPLKTVLLAAHLRALNVLSGSNDVLTGIVSHGRTETADSERVLGLFLNTLPFRRRLAGGTWLQLVQETFAAERELLPFRRYPLAQMQQDIGNEAPLFEVIFNFVRFQVYDELQTVGGLEVLGSDGGGYTNFTLAVDFSLEGGSQVVLELQYDTTELSKEQIKMVGRSYLTTLESMVRSPLEHYEHQCLLSPGEQQEILYDWNETTTSESECYLPLFEAQVARTPNAAAVVLGAEQLTYAELNQRANQLAHYLQTVGVGPEVPVGVLLDRSLETIVTLFAIFKAGGAYVPLDPEYPDERLKFMVRDAGVELVVTQEKLSSRLSDTVVKSIRIDVDWPEIANESQDNPPLLAAATNLAYIIYTSGSSGTPKGAMVTHGGMLNCLQWMQQRYALTEQDSFLMHTSLNFDPSVWEVFWPLMVGGRVVVVPSTGMLDSSVFHYMDEQKVSCAYFVPSLLGVLVKEPGLSDVSSLRYVISGGEKLSLGVIREFQELSRAELHHSYGPTETAIAATEWTCTPGAERVLMGRPIGNTHVYVLDQQMEPVPVGVAGELYIGGAGVGRGYAGRAELTAERFVPDRFSAKVGARLYRTGDMVRYDGEGSLEFLGRVDEQVKLRGYRIELGEIEAVLRRHEHVSAAVVVLSEDDVDDKRLVAYVVGDAGASELRSYLKAHLPGYMVPSLFVALNELPLLPNGKLNRRALPSPYQSTTSDSLTTPRDALELQLVQIWKEVLGREQIGLRDNFLDLGGHSLLALRLINKVERLVGQKLPLSILFQGATIEQLATTLRQRDGTVREQSLVAIQPEGSRPPLFLVHSASGNVMSYVALARRLGGEQPVYGLQSRGLEPDRPPTTRVEEMASEYLQELTAVQPEGPYHLGGWSMGGVIAFEMARQLSAQGKSVAPIVLIDSVIRTDRAETNGWDNASLLLALAQHHGVFLDERTCEELSSLSLDEQLGRFHETGAAYDQFPRDIGVPELRHLFELFKVNVHAAESYRAAISEQQVILLQADDAPPDHVAETLERWEQVAEVVAHRLPGDHYSIVTEPNVALLAEQIKSILSA